MGHQRCQMMPTVKYYCLLTHWSVRQKLNHVSSVTSLHTGFYSYLSHLQLWHILTPTPRAQVHRRRRQSWGNAQRWSWLNHREPPATCIFLSPPAVSHTLILYAFKPTLVYIRVTILFQKGFSMTIPWPNKWKSWPIGTTHCFIYNRGVANGGEESGCDQQQNSWHYAYFSWLCMTFAVFHDFPGPVVTMLHALIRTTLAASPMPWQVQDRHTAVKGIEWLGTSVPGQWLQLDQWRHSSTTFSDLPHVCCTEDKDKAWLQISFTLASWQVWNALLASLWALDN